MADAAADIIEVPWDFPMPCPHKGDRIRITERGGLMRRGPQAGEEITVTLVWLCEDAVAVETDCGWTLFAEFGDRWEPAP